MRNRVLALVIGLALGGALMAVNTEPVEAGYSISYWTRSNASSYSYSALHEGYHYGGGWWVNNNYWDSASEGPDCSGLVFKSWAMVDSWGSRSKYYWYYGDDEHGPYTARSLRDGCGTACYDVCGSGTGTDCGSSSYGSTINMDAFAKDGHAGLIYSEGSSGYDHILHAKNNASGVVKEYLSWRLQDAYDGIRRYSWS